MVERRAARAIQALQPREDAVLKVLQQVGASVGVWNRDWTRRCAAELGVSTTMLEIYLRAVRRTLGLPLGHPSYGWGPTVRSPSWTAAARAARNWGPFQFLLA